MKKSTIRIVSAIALAWGAVACNEDIAGTGFACDVTKPVGDVTISPANAKLPVRTTGRVTDVVVQLTATARDRLGAPRADVPVVFTSSDPRVATVGPTGLVHAVKQGSVNIKASVCGVSAGTRVIVVSAVSSVKVTATHSTAVVGDTILITARATGQAGTMTDVKFAFSPSSGLARITTLSDSTARVVTLAPGTVMVTAVGERTTGSAAVVVLAKAFLPTAASPAPIDAGGNMTCGIIRLGRTYCWGLNDLSQLGATTETLCSGDIQTQTHTVGTVGRRCSLAPKRVAVSVAFAAISAGDSSACGISTVGRVYCWGSNSHGEVGDGSGALTATATLINSGLRFKAVSVGGAHACALTTGGAAYCWGQDDLGQLGDGRQVNSRTPIPVSGGEQRPAKFLKISAGRTHTCALTSDGTAFCWGSNLSGELGNGGIGGYVDTPVRVASGTRFMSISAGGDYSCGVSVGGAAFCWGNNAAGQLGTGAVGSRSLVPVAVTGRRTFTSITAGRSYACALTTRGEVFCWGENADLQLGRGPLTGTRTADGTPMQVTGGELPVGVTFSSVSAGVNHTCGVGFDGFAYCWGSNLFGALGNTREVAFRGLPQRVATPQ